MELIRSIEACRSALQWRRGKRKVGLLTTMGNLHEGHHALVKVCRERSDISVVSVYVNPLLFAADEDFLSYPRALAADQQIADGVGPTLRSATHMVGVLPTPRAFGPPRLTKPLSALVSLSAGRFQHWALLAAFGTKLRPFEACG